MALRNVSKLFALRRVQSVPAALYHENVSWNYFLKLMKLTSAKIFIRFWNIMRIPVTSDRSTRRTKMLEPALLELQLAVMLWNFRSESMTMERLLTLNLRRSAVAPLSVNNHHWSTSRDFNFISITASSSLATEWVKGKTLTQAGALKNTDIAKELCLPPVKLHCSSK